MCYQVCGDEHGECVVNTDVVVGVEVQVSFWQVAVFQQADSHGRRIQKIFLNAQHHSLW